jgi:hypothetical protein
MRISGKISIYSSSYDGLFSTYCTVNCNKKNENMDTGEKAFKVASSMKGLMGFGLFFFGAGLILSILLPFFEPALIKMWLIWIPVIIGYFFFLRIFIKAWQKRNSYITVNEKGIAESSPGSLKEFIKWEDILTIRENSIFERLTITDKNGKQIKVEYELENLTSFINILIRKIPHLTNKFTSITKFHRIPNLHILYTIVFFLMGSFATFSFLSGENVPALVIACFSSFFVYLLLVEFIRIEVTKKGIITIFPLWRKTIEFSQIENVTLENIRVGNGKATQCVLLKLKDSKSVNLNGVKEGTIPLYTSINNKLVKHSS